MTRSKSSSQTPSTRKRVARRNGRQIEIPMRESSATAFVWVSRGLISSSSVTSGSGSSGSRSGSSGSSSPEQEYQSQGRSGRSKTRRERKEKRRVEQQQELQERQEKERQEQERQEEERREKERQIQERLEHERLEHERLEQERREQERWEQDRQEQERRERERRLQERQQARREQERQELEREEQERQERRQRQKELRRLTRHNEDLECSITAVEALLLSRRKSEYKHTLSEYRQSNRYDGDDEAVRNEKLSEHTRAVTKLLLEKMPISLNQFPRKILKLLPTCSRTIVQDLAEQIRKAVEKTHKFVTELGEQELREQKMDSNLRVTKLLCSAMDAHVAEIKALRRLPDSLEVCLNLMLFIVEKSYIPQEPEVLEEMEQSETVFVFGSETADRFLAKLCYDASERNDEGLMMLDIEGVLARLLEAVEKCRSARFFKKSIAQLETMRWSLRVEIRDPGDSGYSSDEDFADVEVIFDAPMENAEHGRGNEDWEAGSEGDSDGSTIDGVNYVIDRAVFPV